MKKLRSALRFTALLLLTKRTSMYQCAFAACAAYGIAQWSFPAALIVVGVVGIAAIEVRG